MDNLAQPTGQLLPEAASTSYPEVFPEVLGAAIEFSNSPYILVVSLILLLLGIKLFRKGLLSYLKPSA